MVTIQRDTARIELDNPSKAKPGVAVNLDTMQAVTHLTEGFERHGRSRKTTQGDAKESKLPQLGIEPAWTALGIVNISNPHNEPLTGWNFGFIQIAKIERVELIFAGKKKETGSIRLSINDPPALTQKLLLDSLTEEMIPWTRGEDNRFQIEDGREARARMGDHPIHRSGLTLTNQVTRAKNFLFEMSDERRFWTVFTVQDPAGKRTFLAHFVTTMSCIAQFQWNKGTPIGNALPASRFKHSKVAAGAPADAAVQKILARPDKPLHNQEMPAALVRAITGGPPNRFDFDTWFIDFGAFWTD